MSLVSLYFAISVCDYLNLVAFALCCSVAVCFLLSSLELSVFCSLCTHSLSRSLSHTRTHSLTPVHKCTHLFAFSLPNISHLLTVSGALNNGEFVCMRERKCVRVSVCVKVYFFLLCSSRVCVSMWVPVYMPGKSSHFDMCT